MGTQACHSYPVWPANLLGTSSGATLPVSRNSFTTPALEDTKGCFTAPRSGLTGPARQPSSKHCQIVSRVSVWNELLCHARLQLREVCGTRGQLALVAADTRCLPKPTEEKKTQAVALVHWLLAAHRCVAAVDISVSEGHDELIRDPFWANSSIETLKFDSGSIENRQNLFTFVSFLGRLEELECTTYRGCADDCLVGALGSLLRSTTSLRSLKLSALRVEKKWAYHLVEDLSSNSTVKELSLHASVADCTTFQEYLQCAVNLTSLSGSLEAILTGLIGNASITDVRLEDFWVEWESAELVFKVLAQNPLLRNFHLTFSMCTLFSEPSSNYRLWVAALEETGALEEVTLPIDILRPQEWEAVFRAVSTNESIKRVTIQQDNVPLRSSLPELCRVLRESGADGKALLRSCITDDIDVLSCKAFTLALASWRFFPDTAQVLKVVRYLPSLSHITSLKLEVKATDFVGELVSTLAEYIRSTCTLQKLSLQTWGQGESDSWKAFVQSLSENESVEKLEVFACTVTHDNAEGFADLVHASRTISTLGFNVSCPCEVGAFVRRLSQAVRNNYTLLNIVFHGEVPRNSVTNWFTVWDTARRNAGLVALAAEFVAGSRRDGYCAQALELVSSHPALVKEITKLAAVTETEASAMVKKRLGDIASMLAFMQKAGIVKNKLECHPPVDKQLQLDDLNEDCLRLLRSFLKISDVRGVM
ncbi:hypothetical protein HPB48_017063 [Haemaphysalis longicornis]|uniref:Uncharacterized protein n=1 Tax=Haemaphysalis longicornis TaxID=44386 RepID=A0A9J6H1Q3_HAELO|nr:hypothetical protein HPB48_017063 [Haemaphysalis longicornis]